jgi:hypothetical protein
MVRISKGTFPLARLDEVEPLLAHSESALRAPSKRCRDSSTASTGSIELRVGVTNAGVWDSMEHAHATTHLQETVAPRPALEAAGVVFETVTNHDEL